MKAVKICIRRAVITAAVRKYEAFIEGERKTGEERRGVHPAELNPAVARCVIKTAGERKSSRWNLSCLSHTAITGAGFDDTVGSACGEYFESLVYPVFEDLKGLWRRS